MKTVRLFFGLFVIVAIVFLSWKIVPVYFNNYQFEEAMDDTARMAAVDSRKGTDEIRDVVLEKAKSFDIPLDANDIEITKAGADIAISAEYSVRIDVPVYPFDLKFNPSTKRQGLTFK